MTQAQKTRRQQLDSVVMAFAISLAFHVSLFTALELNHRFHWWNNIPVLNWLQEKLHRPVNPLAVETHKAKPPPERDVELQFVDVDPALATLEPPKQTKYYSALSSKAANPETKLDSNIPKIDGQQTKIVKSFDTPRAEKSPPQLQSPPVETKPEVKATEAQSKPIDSTPPGDLAMNKPEVKSAPEKPKSGTDMLEVKPSPPPRPRNLAEARQQKGIVVAPKMKQPGGIKRPGPEMLDVKGTTFGAYDAAIVAAVQQRWYDLLEQRRFAGDGIGKVVLQFHLNVDGKITEMKTNQSEVGDLLALICQRAVLDPSPYARWPSDMQRSVGRNYREVRFTFYY